MLDFASKQVLDKLPPLDIPSVLNDPTVQTITKLATDENVQKIAKEGIQNVMKIGDELGKGLDKLFNKKGGMP